MRKMAKATALRLAATKKEQSEKNKKRISVGVTNNRIQSNNNSKILRKNSFKDSSSQYENNVKLPKLVKTSNKNIEVPPKPK